MGVAGLSYVLPLSIGIVVLLVIVYFSYRYSPRSGTTMWKVRPSSANLPIPELLVVSSPYRFVVSPIINYVLKLAQEDPTRRIVTVVPELVEKRWYHDFLHTQRATLLKTRLIMEGNDRISVLNIPWYLKTC